ncbi:putative Ig domain-containing protein, partial [Peptostreptococcus sp.]|uniref:putative Ig domain-containing protein n=1 Tax=Peptostreptococcus sp. TaxID=1262 RepID=UPI001CB12874
MNQRDLFRKKIEEKKEKASKKPRYGMRKLSVGFVSCLVGFVMFLTGVPVMAEGGQSRSVNNEVHYTLAGETDGVLDYARTDYTKEDSDGIHLTVTKWAKLPGTWGYTERGPYNGRYLLNFFEDDFYTQIESIKVNNTEFEKEANGALWKVPIENATLHSGGIGAITNDDIVIKLKSGASLTSLGLADKKINFTTTWVRNDAKADTGGYDNGYILKNNTNVPTLPSNPSNGNEYYLGTGLNGLTNDGTKSKDGNFTSGNTGKVVSYDAKEKAIRSTVSFKPDQNFLQANSGWVLYINEVIPKELLKYIDTNNVRLGVSTSRGKITANEPIKLTVDPNGNGHISTKDTPELSIEGGDWDRVTKVRSTLDSQVFYGALGQRRSYTIEYKLKSDVSNQEFAKALNEYITTNNSQLNFESWLTADFVDSTNAFPGIRKPDGGKPNKILQNSYANAFMEVLDTDKDGLYDFLEDEIDSDKFKVDTDGDGVPDGQEVLADKTDPKNAKSYLVVKPDVTTKTIEANSTQTIVGKVPKTIYDNPADTSKKLAATNPDAGNVIVKAYKYVADNTDYTTQPVKAQTTIPFADLTDGNFTVNVPAGTFAEGDKVILVAYSPDGNNPKVSSTTVRVGAIKVTFDTNGGKWSDGTNADKIVNAVNGAATQPEEPTRDGYQFLGWASTDNATVAEAGILDNVSEDKEVFAVWKDNKAPVIGNIGDQTVVERNAITEINVTTDDPTATVTVKDLPSGLTYSNGKISGTPSVTSWGNDEKKEFTVTVEAKDPSGNTSTKTFKIIVHRDTDRDGTPDITDTDDDGDGVPDTVEIAKGSDPKNPNSRPMGTVTPVSPTTISNPTQTLIDENAITNIVITPGNTASTVTVDTSKLPNGVTYDPITKTISGTPDVTNWGTDETKKFDIPVVITNPDGSKVTKTVEITVQRDTDSDGTPDVTDTDDDGDGVTDTEEIAKGSDPKNPNSRPMGTVTPVSPTTISNPTQTLIDENAITNIVITPGNTASTVTVDTSKLPNGVTYDPITKTIS